MTKLMFAGLAFAAVLAVNTGPSFAGTAAENVKACAVQWQSMKTANTVPAGTNWLVFEKDCLAKMQAAATPAVPAVPAAKIAAPAVPAVPAAKIAAPAAPAAATAVAVSANDKICADQWAQMSAVRKVLSGSTFETFKAGCLAKLQAAAVPAPKVVVPVAPVAPAAAAAVAPSAKVGAPAASAAPVATATGGTNGEQSRIKTCAAQWDQMKVAKTTPVGLKWPQFWHECDVKLKASGL